MAIPADGAVPRPAPPEQVNLAAGKHQTDQEMAEFGLELLGPYGTLVHGSPYAVKGGNAALSYMIMRAASIGGGTPEVSRNVIGERMLGLPRD